MPRPDAVGGTAGRGTARQSAPRSEHSPVAHHGAVLVPYTQASARFATYPVHRLILAAHHRAAVGSINVGSAITLLVLASVVIWIDWRLLSDLAQTPDDQLQYMTRVRRAAALVFPLTIGAIFS